MSSRPIENLAPIVRDFYMRYVLSVFQTADGGPHWLSILTILGWLVTGAFICSQLVINRNDRIKNGPWQLTEAQRDRFSSALNGAVKGKVAIEYSSADGKRSHDFAVKLRDILQNAGYDVWGYLGAFHQANGPPLTGVQFEIVRDQPSDYVAADIQKAFRELSIEASAKLRQHNNYPPDTATIFIGIKP